MRPATCRRLALGAAAAGLLAALHLAGAGDLLSPGILARRHTRIAEIIDARPAAAAAGYVLIYAAAVALSLPGAAALTITGGLLFGPLLGALLAVLGAPAGATCVLLLARRLACTDALEHLGPHAARLAQAPRADAASCLIAVRLVPLLPFFLVDLVPAPVGVPLRIQAATTLVGILPKTFVLGLAGAGLGTALAAGEAIDACAAFSPEILAALAATALLSLAKIPIRRRLAARALLSPS